MPLPDQSGILQKLGGTTYILQDAIARHCSKYGPVPLFQTITYKLRIRGHHDMVNRLACSRTDESLRSDGRNQWEMVRNVFPQGLDIAHRRLRHQRRSGAVSGIVSDILRGPQTMSNTEVVAT
jgi:hypothetical protein